MRSRETASGFSSAIDSISPRMETASAFETTKKIRTRKRERAAFFIVGIVAESQARTKRICRTTRFVVQRSDEEGHRSSRAERPALCRAHQTDETIRRGGERTRPAVRRPGGIDCLSAAQIG